MARMYKRIVKYVPVRTKKKTNRKKMNYRKFKYSRGHKKW